MVFYNATLMTMEGETFHRGWMQVENGRITGIGAMNTAPDCEDKIDLEGALVFRSGTPTATPMARELASGRSAQELMQAIAQLQTCVEYAQGNVSPAAICGHLEWALR